MAALDRSADLSLWSDDMRGAIRRRLRECGGVALITLAVMAMIALATWSVQDPSLNHATNGPVRNLLGSPGAIVSDLMMQLFGLASLALVLPIVVWGCRMVAHRGSEFDWRRIPLWCVAITFASAFAACLPPTAAWPLPTGLGGVIGDVLLRIPVMYIGPLRGMTLLVVTAGTGLVTAAAIVTASAIGWRKRAFAETDGDWAEIAAGPADDDAEKASISLGWLAHGLLSLKARLLRLVMDRRVRRMPGLAAGAIVVVLAIHHRPAEIRHRVCHLRLER